MSCEPVLFEDSPLDRYLRTYLKNPNPEKLEWANEIEKLEWEDEIEKEKLVWEKCWVKQKRRLK